MTRGSWWSLFFPFLFSFLVLMLIFYFFIYTLFFLTSLPTSSLLCLHPEEHITQLWGAVTWGCCPFVINDIDSQWVEAPDCLCANELKSEQQHLDPPPIHHRLPPRTLLMTSAIFGGSCRVLDLKIIIIIMIMSRFVCNNYNIKSDVFIFLLCYIDIKRKTFLLSPLKKNDRRRLLICAFTMKKNANNPL